jgi:DNA polymerase-3 subunit delta
VGTAPPRVLWARASEIRAPAANWGGRDSGKSLPALPTAVGVSDQRRNPSLPRALPRLSTARLRGALLLAARIDRMIKGLAQGDLWDEFLVLALRLARR